MPLAASASWRRLGETLDCDHPYLVKRACALKQFYESPRFRQRVGQSNAEGTAEREMTRRASPFSDAGAAKPYPAEIAAQQIADPRRHAPGRFAAASGQGSAGNVIAALCSLFIPGLGQLVQGRVLMGLAHFVSAGMLWLVLLGWTINLWSTIDAAKFKPRAPRMP